ncbi:hypothetical protein IscW_ISCW015894 [Ixodes scapularis]|uniref:Uncharacterized protein n=1 Tax=Ixodes scapularis TaxID=6945 RepID=B7P4K6_IXOSC|nr:hypothetical protein IscW_ISCW015894 [Ixodes scapularis]|eukprot:XP_002406199.1 hypothetical protein IscW_ISCW015894 [Ixodes scapularis]
MEGRDRRATGADRWGDSPDPIDLGAGEFLTAFSSSGWGSGVSGSGVPHDQEEHALRAAGRRTNVGCQSGALQSTMRPLPCFARLDRRGEVRGHGPAAELQRVRETCMDAVSRDIDVGLRSGRAGYVRYGEVHVGVPDCLRSVGRTDGRSLFSGY